MRKVLTKGENNALQVLSPATNTGEWDTLVLSVLQTIKATAGQVSLDSSFLDAMTSKSPNSWNTNVLLEKVNVNFKLDLGAEVTTITEETFKLLNGTKRPSHSMSQPGKVSMY